MEVVVTAGLTRAISRANIDCQIVITNKPTSSFFTGRMPFLSPNQQCQSTEGKNSWGMLHSVLAWGLHIVVHRTEQLGASSWNVDAEPLMMISWVDLSPVETHLLCKLSRSWRLILGRTAVTWDNIATALEKSWLPVFFLLFVDICFAFNGMMC